MLSAEQIESLPVNGLNFLDLVQLEPAVQIRDGANLGNGKDGVSAREWVRQGAERNQ